jgi:hypothetical protein
MKILQNMYLITTSPAGILWIENLETVILSEVFLW